MARLALLGLLLGASIALASTTGSEFQFAFQFFLEAANGYLGRTIAIVGGLIGLATGATRGKALPAVIGVILAIFGAFGPEIVDSIFASATVTIKYDP